MRKKGCLVSNLDFGAQARQLALSSSLVQEGAMLGQGQYNTLLEPLGEMFPPFLEEGSQPGARGVGTEPATKQARAGRPPRERASQPDFQGYNPFTTINAFARPEAFLTFLPRFQGTKQKYVVGGNAKVFPPYRKTTVAFRHRW